MTDETYAAFVDRFLLPFWQVESRQPRLADALGPEFATRFAETRVGGSAEEEIYKSICTKAGICGRFSIPWPQRDVWSWSVLAHDLLLAADPKTSSRRRRRLVESLTLLVEGIAPLTHADQLVVRHAAIGQLQRCVRKDTTVRFWAGTRVFHGRPVPKRVLRLPGLRRVRTSHSHVRIDEALPHNLNPVLKEVLLRSPLSWLTQDDTLDLEARPNDNALCATLQIPSLRAYVADKQHDSDLAWIPALRNDASAPLCMALDRLTLELEALGAPSVASSGASAGVSPEMRRAFRNHLASSFHTARLITESTHTRPEHTKTDHG